jgi:Transmembrane family 220, helix
MKILNIVLAVLFVLFAAVQYNDPDPYIWVPIYLFCAYVCGSSAMGKSNSNVILIGLIPITVYMLTYIPDFIDWVKMGMPSLVNSTKADSMYVELTREFGGLVMCVAALVPAYLKSRKVNVTS